jgi:8-hydroxy-5-deazaflavin:NADPH oxidoreductase
MRIAILGFGNVGAQLGRLWAAKGHTITAGLRQGGKGTDTARRLGIAVAEPAAAVGQADVIALALPWLAVESALASLGPLDRRILLDATNPLTKDLSVIVPEAGSAGQQVAQWAKGARVVKTFNTIGATRFGDPAFDMLYCGDDADAKDKVRSLIEDTSMTPVDVGPLKNAAYLEQIAGLWIDLTLNRRIEGAFGFKLAFTKQ